MATIVFVRIPYLMSRVGSGFSVVCVSRPPCPAHQHVATHEQRNKQQTQTRSQRRAPAHSHQRPAQFCFFNWPALTRDYATMCDALSSLCARIVIVFAHHTPVVEGPQEAADPHCWQSLRHAVSPCVKEKTSRSDTQGPANVAQCWVTLRE